MLRIRLASAFLTLAAVAGCSNGFTTPNQKPGETAELQAEAKGKKTSPEQKLALAAMADSTGDVRRAEQIYRELLAENPNLGPAHHGLGLVMARRGDYKEAEQQFQAALAGSPENVTVLNDLGYCYSLQNRLPEAEKTLRSAIHAEPNNKRALNNLAHVVGLQGRSQEAYEMFRRAGSEAQALSNLAFVHVQLADTEKAKTLYSRALDRDSTLRPAAYGLAELAKHEQLEQKKLGLDQPLSPEEEVRVKEQVKKLLPKEVASLPAAPAAAVAEPAAAVPAPQIAQVAHQQAVAQATPEARQAVHAEPVAPQSFENVPWGRMSNGDARPVAGTRASYDAPLPQGMEDSFAPAMPVRYQQPAAPALAPGQTVVREWNSGAAPETSPQPAAGQNFVSPTVSSQAMAPMRIGTGGPASAPAANTARYLGSPELPSVAVQSSNELAATHSQPQMPTAAGLAPRMPDFPAVNVPPPAVGKDVSPASQVSSSLAELLSNLPSSGEGIPTAGGR